MLDKLTSANIRLVCKDCGSWQDNDYKIHYVNACDQDVNVDHDWMTYEQFLKLEL